ncbi:unnamed protein product [Ectocarpus sp. 12 AP-2014]
MARRRSKQAAVAATASLLLVGLGLTALNPRNRALLPMVQDSSGNHRPLQESRAAAVGGRGEAGQGWPESWGREVGLRPGVRLPNQGRSKVGWAGVRDDSGWRSPHYGDVQRGHQAWLLQRAEEMRSSEGVASVDTHSGGRVEGGTGDTNAAQGNTDGQGEEAGVTGEAGESEGGSPVAVDSEGPTRAGEAAAAAGGRGLEGRGDAEVFYSRAVVAASATATAAGGGAETGTRRPRLRRGLRRQGATREVGGEGAQTAPTEEMTPPSEGKKKRVAVSAAGGTRLARGGLLEDDRATRTPPTTTTMRRTTDAGEERAQQSSVAATERVWRLKRGAELWPGTYVPPIEPTRRRELIYKWSYGKGPEESAGVTGGESGRILYVISSYDRGKRLGLGYDGKVDKLDYILMMMDEMREACEAGFSPHVHLIAAWDTSEVADLIRDRLFCQRTGELVPYSHEEHPPSVRNNLAIKHRIYMKPRVEDFDVFVQVEDDMIVTLNHILLYREECDNLEERLGMGGSRGRPNVFVPGFLRVEPGGTKDKEKDKGEGEWFEWEIVFNPIKIYGAGTYMSLSPSKVLPRAGNNQGMWMATREQLKKMAANKACDYLEFDESSTNGIPEMHSGSIQMFLPECGFIKVFPATHFEDFMVHHRTNNKNGRAGESIPGVSTAMLRVWAGQFLRDEGVLQVLYWTIPRDFGTFP